MIKQAVFGGLCVLTLLAVTSLLVAKEPASPIVKGSAKTQANAKSVEMFAAMKAGDIEVQFIPKNAEEARVMVKNNTKQPLHIEMPAAFGAVPVLAQGLGGSGTSSGNSGGAQSSGGGMGGGMMGGGMGGGGGGMGGMGGGGGGGFFNVAPERVGQFKVGLVCLEHGKKDPRPGIPYEIKPIDTVSKDPAVHELLRQMANDRYSHRAAQAAAWHLANGMTWRELAAKVIPHLNAPAEPYFSAEEIQLGMKVAEDAAALAEKRSTSTSSASASAQDQKAATN